MIITKSIIIMGVSDEYELLSLIFNQIIECVSSDAGDMHVLQMNVRLHNFVREFVWVFASTSVPSSRLGLCKPLVVDKFITNWLKFSYGLVQSPVILSSLVLLLKFGGLEKEF